MMGMQNVFDRIQKHVRASMHTDPQAQSDHLPHPFFLLRTSICSEADSMEKLLAYKNTAHQMCDVLSGEFFKTSCLICSAADK